MCKYNKYVLNINKNYNVHRFAKDVYQQYYY